MNPEQIPTLFLVLKHTRKSLSEWQTPDAAFQCNGAAVESLVIDRKAAFVAWRRTARPIRGFHDDVREAVPCVCRLTPEPVTLRAFTITAEVAGEIEPRGEVLAVDAGEAIHVAQLAGLVFVASTATAHANATAFQQPQPSDESLRQHERKQRGLE